MKLFLAFLTMIWTGAVIAQQTPQQIYDELYQDILNDDLMYESNFRICVDSNCKVFPSLKSLERNMIEVIPDGPAVTQPNPERDNFEMMMAIERILTVISQRAQVQGSVDVNYKSKTNADGSTEREFNISISGGAGGATPPPPKQGSGGSNMEKVIGPGLGHELLR